MDYHWDNWDIKSPISKWQMLFSWILFHPILEGWLWNLENFCRGIGRSTHLNMYVSIFNLTSPKLNHFCGVLNRKPEMLSIQYGTIVFLRSILHHHHPPPRMFFLYSIEKGRFSLIRIFFFLNSIVIESPLEVYDQFYPFFCKFDGKNERN